MKCVRQAVILAGGKGKRLRPLTFTIPKPMIPINGKPFLEYLVELLKQNNIKEVIMLVGYLHQKIEEYFKNGASWGLPIRYSYSPIESDTGARVRNALPLLDNQFLLLYGDNYWPLRIQDLTRRYREMGTKGLVTVYSNLDHSTKNNVAVNDRGLVLTYDPNRIGKYLNGVDIGFFLLDKTIFEDSPEGNFSFEDDVLPKLIKQKELSAYMTHHKYYSLSNRERIPVITDYLRSKKTVLLDRDGVINKRPAKGNYVTDWKEFIFLPKAKEALRILQKKGYKIYIISNQAGVARGIMTREQVDEVNNKMKNELKKNGIEISDIFICPHSWDQGCFCRKPNPGLLFEASYKHHFDLYNSYCIGDDIRDIQAGKSAGCKTISIENGIERDKKSDFTYKNLYEAARHL